LQASNLSRLLSLPPLFFIIAVFTTSAHSAEGSYINNTEILQSKVLNEERKVVVRLPKSYAKNTTQHYPVIYRLDGAGNLPMMNAVFERLQSQSAAPEVIIVAIENTDRLRDMYPTVNQDPRGPVGVGGGGAKFLEFIKTELIPFVDKSYRTHDYKVIAGASAGGAFALYTMQSPDLFQAHIAYSPAVWWNDGSLVKSNKSYIKKAKDMDAFVFMSMGNEGGIMRPYYDDLLTFMKTNKPLNMDLVTEEYPNVTHNLVSGASIFSAYHNLFLPLNMPVSVFDGNIDSIKTYYQQVSTQRGQTITPPEWVMRQLGYTFTDQNDFATAIKIFNFNIEINPSSEAYNGLAFALERAGRYNESLVQVNKALDMAKPENDGYSVFVGRRDRLEKLINESK